MTHGEMWYARKMEMYEKNFNDFDDFNEIHGLPKRMGKKEAGKYYNAKLFNYWVDSLDERIPLKRREQALSLMMFGDKDIYKKLQFERD